MHKSWQIRNIHILNLIWLKYIKKRRRLGLQKRKDQNCFQWRTSIRTHVHILIAELLSWIRSLLLCSLSRDNSRRLLLKVLDPPIIFSRLIRVKLLKVTIDLSLQNKLLLIKMLGLLKECKVQWQEKLFLVVIINSMILAWRKTCLELEIKSDQVQQIWILETLKQIINNKVSKPQ